MQEALNWIDGRRTGVLITLRRDGRAQSSDVAYAVVDGTVKISVTADRAKTRNMGRDNRVVLHVTAPSDWSYVSLDGTVELTPVASSPDDATCDELVDYFRRVTGDEHSDWDEYRRAMVDEGRLVARFTPTKATGQING